MGVEINFAGREDEYRKQYSVWYYLWMQETWGTNDGVLGRVIKSNNVNWAAEHVFRVNYREYRLSLREGELFSPDFGDKTLRQMAEDAILIREKAGVRTERTEAEKRGILELERVLVNAKEGQAVVLISPPDPDDQNMAGYNMIYVYEKQKEGQIRATAIRDETSSLEDLAVLTKYLSGAGSWDDATHLDFVAKPFVTGLSFSEVVSEVGIREKDVVPDWLEIMASEVASAMLYELGRGRMEKVKEIFDAFQIAVKTRHQTNIWVEPMKMVEDKTLWMIAQRNFLMAGGMEMIQAGGSCGAGDIKFKQDFWRDNNVLSSLMGVEERQEETYSFDHEGQCVVCKQDPRMLGPCNICEECDHKIRAQMGE